MSDPEGHHFYQNKAFCESLEYENAEELEAMGGGMAAIADKSIAQEIFLNIMKGNSWSGELNMCSKSGRVFPCLARADAIKDEEDNIIGLIGIFTDITEQKKIQKKLLFNNALLKGQSETTIDGILIVNEKGKLIFFNNQFGDMWNIRQDLLDTKDEDKIIAHISVQLKNPDNFVKIMKEIHTHKNDKSREEISFLDGKTFDIYSSPLMDSQDRYLGRVWYFRDITIQKQAEEALKKSEKKYRKAYTRAEFYKDLFAHDMSNIFQVILTSIDLCKMKGGFNNIEINQFYQMIKDQIHRGRKLIRNIQKISSIDKKSG